MAGKTEGVAQDLGGDVFRRKKEIVSRAIAGETILVPVVGRLADMQRIFSLNPVGDFVWERIDGRASVSEISDSVVGRFEVGREEALRDVKEFVGLLLEDGLIERVV